MNGMEVISAFRFDKGPHRDKAPSQAPTDYLLKVRKELRSVPPGHELREVLDAVVSELRLRGVEDLAEKAPINEDAFRVPPPIPAAEAERRARRAVAATDSPVGAPAAPRLLPASSPGPTTLMPCGHPTGDLRPVQGSWRGVCGACERLEQYRMAIAGGQDPAEALLLFEAEIRGFKTEGTP